MFIPTIFLFLFSCLQGHTNPTILMDAKQWALTLFLFVLMSPELLMTLSSMPLNNPIIINIIVIIIMQCLYFLTRGGSSSVF